MDLSLRYASDINGTAFVKEMEYLKSAISPFLDEEKTINDLNALGVLNILTINELYEQFVNCHTALRIFLTMPVTVASNERSFSKLKIIKNYMRSSMGQERLSDLGVLSIESEIVSNLCFDELIDNFAKSKCRKAPI